MTEHEQGLGDSRRSASVSGAALISAERVRQVTEEGWTPGHDDEHDTGQLGAAAVCYVLSDVPECYDDFWPWSPRWWKPCPDDRVRELVKAGALIAAEIDRLLRLTEGEQ